MLNTRGNRFNKNSLSNMFTNRRYIGEYRYNDVLVPNAIPAIVTENVFNRVAVRMQQARQKLPSHIC